MSFSHQNAPTNFALNEKKYKFYCNYCDYGCNKKSNFTRHNSTRKHLTNQKTSRNEPKRAENPKIQGKLGQKIKKNAKKIKKNENTGVFCNFCNFRTQHVGTFNRHLKTKKHAMNWKKSKHVMKKNEIIHELNKKKEALNEKIKWIENEGTMDDISTIDQTISNENIVIYNQQSIEPVQTIPLQNHMQNQVQNHTPPYKDNNKDQVNEHTHYHYHVTNYTYNNNNFNMQLYLQENCQNAMNLSDFVKNIKYNNHQSWNTLINEEDLYDTFTNMVVKELEDMDVTERPIHCTDKKTNTVYVRDNNLWEKDNENAKLTNAVDEIHKNHSNMTTQIIKEWREKHPNWVENDTDCEQIHKATANKIKCSKKMNPAKFMKKIIHTTILDSTNGTLTPPPSIIE